MDFDDTKVYEALVKAAVELHREMTPLVHRAIVDIVAAVNREIAGRFTTDIKIYEVQNIVEHALLESHEYDLAEKYIGYRTQRDFARSKSTDINHSIINLLSKDSSVVNENANKDSDVFNTQRDLTAGAVGKAIGHKMLPAARVQRAPEGRHPLSRPGLQPLRAR